MGFLYLCLAVGCVAQLSTWPISMSIPLIPPGEGANYAPNMNNGLYNCANGPFNTNRLNYNSYVGFNAIQAKDNVNYYNDFPFNPQPQTIKGQLQCLQNALVYQGGGSVSGLEQCQVNLLVDMDQVSLVFALRSFGMDTSAASAMTLLIQQQAKACGYPTSRGLVLQQSPLLPDRSIQPSLLPPALPSPSVSVSWSLPVSMPGPPLVGSLPLATALPSAPAGWNLPASIPSPLLGSPFPASLPGPPLPAVMTSATSAFPLSAVSPVSGSPLSQSTNSILKTSPNPARRPKAKVNCASILEPCACIGTCGWSSAAGACMEGKDTDCSECPFFASCSDHNLRDPLTWAPTPQPSPLSRLPPPTPGITYYYYYYDEPLENVEYRQSSDSTMEPEIDLDELLQEIQLLSQQIQDLEDQRIQMQLAESPVVEQPLIPQARTQPPVPRSTPRPSMAPTPATLRPTPSPRPAVPTFQPTYPPSPPRAPPSTLPPSPPFMSAALARERQKQLDANYANQYLPKAQVIIAAPQLTEGFIPAYLEVAQKLSDSINEDQFPA